MLIDEPSFVWFIKPMPSHFDENGNIAFTVQQKESEILTLIIFDEICDGSASAFKNF